VHLDLPTTLRVAEQRVGRVDRMDSRHDRIEVHWPRDGQAFATRANERLTQRVEESRALLGANLALPDLRRDAATPDEAVVAVKEVIQASEEPRAVPASARTTVGIEAVTQRRRELLADDPGGVPHDPRSAGVLAEVVQLAARSERALLPRRLSRALDQLDAASSASRRVLRRRRQARRSTGREAGSPRRRLIDAPHVGGHVTSKTRTGDMHALLEGSPAVS